jgi:hypothetical protein
MKAETPQRNRARQAMHAVNVDSGELLNAMCQLEKLHQTEHHEVGNYLDTMGLGAYTELVVNWLVKESQRKTAP